MEMTFQMVYDRINACAPFDTQADFDNSGFLLGKEDSLCHWSG